MSCMIRAGALSVDLLNLQCSTLAYERLGSCCNRPPVKPDILGYLEKMYYWQTAKKQQHAAGDCIYRCTNSDSWWTHHIRTTTHCRQPYNTHNTHILTCNQSTLLPVFCFCSVTCYTDTNTKVSVREYSQVTRASLKTKLSCEHFNSKY